ncbi:hypothetical protein F7734_17585 [Scytonema sp. UIC 10036]|uniref:glycine-rich domain-containing protein n=1 Tax=Scytonema sp. UIC 10036 TaxID=2304196 RepID=UPI0012DAC48B|nr:hypothetical protein [Scytonema sp. UIC 10036]MUG94105.1 hypothetical protein [Scytonema sp. UIC 10036]
MAKNLVFIELEEQRLNINSLDRLQVVNLLYEKISTFSEKLYKLDLQPVAKKLMCCDRGHGWTAQQTELAISLYKMFLCLHFLFPDTELIPTKEIDEVWHTHILLNTDRYIQDCQELYGYILHHYSPVNENLEVQHQHYATARAVTKTLFEKLFGVSVLENQEPQSPSCLILSLSSLQESACLTIPKI